MSVSILGHHISLIRPSRVYKPWKSGQVWRTKKFRTKTIKLTRQKMREIANQMGYNFMEVQT